MTGVRQVTSKRVPVPSGIHNFHATGAGEQKMSDAYWTIRSGDGGILDTASKRKLGAYYTPTDAAHLMASWVLRESEQVVLEPSFGDGVFLSALREVSTRTGVSCRIFGVEIDEVAFSREKGWAQGDVALRNDFHLVEPSPVDAVVGNPPFVRLRHLPVPQSAAAETALRRVVNGPVDKSGSTWMSVALHASSFLRPGGRMALVLPSDALYVRYARSFWQHLGASFGSLSVLRCKQRIFPDILQDVVLLLADRHGASTREIEYEIFLTRADLAERSPASVTRVPIAEISARTKPFTRATAGPRFPKWWEENSPALIRASAVVKHNIGYVSGSKSFFQPDPETVEYFELPARSLRPTLANSRSLKGSGLNTANIDLLDSSRLWLPNPDNLTNGERRYIAHGESLGLDRGYKCSRRSPWFVVPDVRVPDLVLTVFGSLPTLVINGGGFVASNSLLLGFQDPGVVSIDAYLVAWYSSVGMLGIETSVHSLGGGVLVAVPSEADSIFIPNPSKLRPSKAAIASIHSALLQGDVEGAYAVGDRELRGAGWGTQALATARRMAHELRSWRERR